MTQIQLTDQQLNRALAELMGYTIYHYDYHYDKDVAERCYFELTAPDGYPEIVFGGERNTELEAWADVPNYCNDPAASLEVQAKAIEVDAQGYLYNLATVVNGYEAADIWEDDEIISMLKASPRERAEAAYITLSQVRE
ncbi:hypothetical protein [Paenibacillus sp. FSL L8-0708]|uniref:hypothetical protein n=1 Tax=Paenibacillus sp. FSL L8-0708 TaxID=2975311 RepID=UPI0030FC484F